MHIESNQFEQTSQQAHEPFSGAEAAAHEISEKRAARQKSIVARAFSLSFKRVA